MNDATKTMKKAEFDVFAAEYTVLHEQSLGVFRTDQDRFAEYKILDVARKVEELGATSATRRILDFGAGCGTSVPYFRKHFPDASLTCLDVSEESLDIARKNFPSQAEFIVCEGKDIPAPSASYDLAFSACVFHHIDHGEHAVHLLQLNRILRPGGLLFIFEHNPLNPFTLHVVNNCPFDRNAHLIRAGRMKARVRAAGFEDVEVRFRLFLPPSLPRLRALERYLEWLPFGAQYHVVARKTGG